MLATGDELPRKKGIYVYKLILILKVVLIIS